MRGIPFIICASLACLSAIGQAQSAPTATITVDAKHVIGKVQPLVFGHNVEAADSYNPDGTPQMHSAIRAEGLWDPEKKQLVPEMVTMSKEVGVKMMRYPGGCLTHNFNWHEAVGPIDQRPNFSFGIDEFIAYCRAVGAEPLMSVSEYTGTPQDSADLVEYLNAPADARHPWAQKRAQWGHPQPYGVRYFEIGNESDHGNHLTVNHKQYNGKAYADRYIAAAKLMRNIDSRIKIGVVSDSAPSAYDPWNVTVFTMTKGLVDFVIIHTYSAGAADENTALKTPADTLMRGCMVASSKFEACLADYREVIKECTGKNLPLAITEYNSFFVQEKPIPYRFCYGAALFSADYVRVLLKPESNVLMANYWHLANGYWGMIRGLGPYQKMPAYYLYRLWAQHFGPKLVEVNATSPRVMADGTPAAPVVVADPRVVKEKSGRELFDIKAVKPVRGPGYSIEAKPDGTLVAQFDHMEQEAYPDIMKIAAPWVGAGYMLSFEARATGDLANCRIGLGLND
ncbi:MAG TPA: alpha-L-arabinofuranosidase, partial [Armatimonadota bacterium]|nr:alpha-L-arabinofuranosidase [Armatimonadota bacterium]